jgi:hypothetical protein
MFPGVHRPIQPAAPRPQVPKQHRSDPHRPAPASHHVPAARSEHYARPQSKPKSRRLAKILLVLLIVFGLAGGGAWAYKNYAHPNPFPAQIQTDAQFPLFYPHKLPPGYAVDQNSFNYANSQVIYNAHNGANKIVFTIQKAPAGLNFNTFYKQQLTNMHNYTTAYGPAVIGTNDKRQLGSLVADGTWMLLSTNSSSVTLGDMSLVMNNLKKY